MTPTTDKELLERLAACKASDPYRTKSWIPHMRGKWMTVNVPTDLWNEIRRAAASMAVSRGEKT